MTTLDLFFAVQLCLAVGVAGLFWPDKFIFLFEILLFPWVATYRAVRINSIAAIGLSALLFFRLLASAG